MGMWDFAATCPRGVWCREQSISYLASHFKTEVQKDI